MKLPAIENHKVSEHISSSETFGILNYLKYFEYKNFENIPKWQ
jgi:hypothetical protein